MNGYVVLLIESNFLVTINYCMTAVVVKNEVIYELTNKWMPSYS